MQYVNKGGSMKVAIAALCLITILGALSGCGYNTMQAQEEAVFAAWADVEAAYQRRADLIPNLVEVVKGYAKYEGETLTAVTEARSRVGSVKISKEMLSDPQAFDKFQQAQGQLGGALSRLLSWSKNILISKQTSPFSICRTRSRYREPDKCGEGTLQQGSARI